MVIYIYIYIKIKTDTSIYVAAVSKFNIIDHVSRALRIFRVCSHVSRSHVSGRLSESLSESLSGSLSLAREPLYLFV